jgi:tyrosyl-tRNA synthetase
MSKSFGNAIGIHEAPLEMYGKIMSISDEMMWRYYELLTDVQVSDIEKIKRETHPMQAKKELARRIVGDFHSAEAAVKAEADWARQFQKSEVPDDIEEVTISSAKVRIGEVSPDSSEGGTAQVIGSDLTDAEVFRVDKLIREAGLAVSMSEAGRKIKERAVYINGYLIQGPAILVSRNEALVVRVGKKIKKVTLAIS